MLPARSSGDTKRGKAKDELETKGGRGWRRGRGQDLSFLKAHAHQLQVAPFSFFRSYLFNTACTTFAFAYTHIIFRAAATLTFDSSFCPMTIQEVDDGLGPRIDIHLCPIFPKPRWIFMTRHSSKITHRLDYQHPPRLWNSSLA